MDHLTIVQCRNSALETELRIVKEQLAQAHASTNYLLSTITTQQAQHARDSITQLQGRLNEALAENVRLRSHTIPQHHLIDRPRAERSLRQRALTHQLQSRLPPSPPFTDEQGLASPYFGVDTDNDDLLSFEGGEGGTINNFSSSTSPLANLPAHLTHKHVPSLLDVPSPVPQTTRGHDPSAPTTVGLGITGLPPTQQPTITPPKDAEGGHTITHADGTTSFITLTPESSFPTPPQFNRPSPPNHAPFGPRYGEFAQFERTYLLGLATFIDDLEGEAYLKKWEDIEKRRGKHSAAEWQGYYERTIRPVFRKREAAKAEALAAAKEVGGDTENDEKGGASVTEGDDADVSGGSLESKGSKVVEESADDEAGMSGESSGSKGNETVEESAVGDTDVSGESFEDKAPEVVQENAVDEADESEHSSDCDDLESQEERAVEQTITPVGKAKEIQVVLASTKVVVNASADDIANPDDKDTSTTTLELERRLEGLLASRWAPKAVAHPGSEVAETEPVSQDNFGNLPTVDEFCAEQELLKKQAAIVLSQRPTEHNRTNSPVPSTSWPTPPPRVPRPRYNNRDGPTREPYTDPRPPCCRYPMHNAELFHSNFAAKHDASVLRTVMIANIPPNVTLAEVLDKIHIGKILATTYLPLSEMLRKSGVMTNAVLVTFLYAGDARRFVERCGKEFLLFWDGKWEGWIKAGVTHVQSPVRGAPENLSIKQIREEGLSRVVYLIDDGAISDPASVVSAVMSVLLQRSRRGGEWKSVKYPVKVGRDGDGMLTFEFGGIVDAVVMRRTLQILHREHGAMGKGFLADPCEANVERVGGEEELDGEGVNSREAGRAELKGVVLGPQARETGEGQEEAAATPAFDSNHHEAESTASAYTTQKPAISTPRSTQLSSPLMMTAPSTPVPAVPRTTPWGDAGDLEAAKAFMASATRGGAREKAKGRRGGDGGEMGYDDETIREGEAFGVEG
ncbi:hypothetical protein LTR10_010056 [Elasticomyces elasticus]|nr:hypothetical protein LTR10_010056 [Elasticomyces elasticus]KAK4970348.1 hypothetical protein LTR42_008515 [Elasticomyces elasticus]